MLTRQGDAAVRIGKPREAKDKHGRPPLQFVSRDLDLVTVGVAKVDRMRDLVILKIEWNRASLQFILRT